MNSEMIPIFFMLVILKIPILAMIWLVWWSMHPKAGGGGDDPWGQNEPDWPSNPWMPSRDIRLRERLPERPHSEQYYSSHKSRKELVRPQGQTSKQSHIQGTSKQVFQHLP